MVDLSKAPYYDAVNAEIDKGYTQLLFTSGKAVQSRELTGIGSFAREHTKKIANLLYKSGTIISGCAIASIDKENATVTMTPGSVFVDGEIFDIVFERPIGSFGELVAVNTDLVSKTLPINMNGDETIYVEIVSDVKDSVNDPDLLDPAEGFDNYHEAGASRLRKIARFITTAHPDYNNEQFSSNPRIPIYTLKDGEIVTNKTVNAENNVTESKPADSSSIDVLDVMSQRNYETLGNYLVEGFGVHAIDCDDATKVGILIDPGIAYINGVRRESSVSKKIYIKKNLLKTTMYNEEHTINNTINEYKLNASPVVGAVVSAPVKVDASMAYATSGRNLINVPMGYPVYKVIRVYTLGDPGTTYTVNKDYKIEGNEIVWLNTTDASRPVSNFHVEYLYKPVLDSNQYEIIGKGSYEVKLKLGVNSLGYAEIPSNYLNPSIYNIVDTANPDVALRKGKDWYQQGNKIKFATTGNALLPVEVVRSSSSSGDVINIADGEVESIKYFSEDGESSYIKQTSMLTESEYDYSFDTAFRRIIWNGEKDNYPPVGETYIANVRLPANSVSNNISNIEVRFAYEINSDLFTSRVYNSWIRFNDGAIQGVDATDTFSIESTIARTRKDAICLNRDGKIVIVHGTIIGENGIYETRENTALLKIADIIVKPTTAKDLAIYTSDNYRLRMQDLRQMFKRIQDIDYNISLTQLEQYAENLAADYSLRGIIAESFNSLGCFDIAGTWNYIDRSSQLAVPNIAESLLYPGYKRCAMKLTVDDEHTTSGRKGGVYALSSGEAEVLWLEQPFGTTTRSLTEGVYESTIFPKLEISPDSDYFVSGGADVIGNNDEYLVIPSMFETYALRNAIGQNISCETTSSAFSAGECTVEFWVKIQSEAFINLLKIGNNITATYRTGKIILSTPTKSVEYNVGDIVDRWVHLAFVFDNNKFRNLVLNDEVVAGEANVDGFSVAGATEIVLGQKEQIYLRLNVASLAYSFANIRIYNSALSSNDIATYMLADTSPDDDHLVAFYSSEVSSGKIVNTSGLSLAGDATGTFTSGDKVPLSELTGGDQTGKLTYIVNTLDLTLGSMPEASSETTVAGISTNTSTSRRSDASGTYTTYSVTTKTTYNQVDTWYTKDTTTKVDDYGTFVTDVAPTLTLRRLRITVNGSGLLPNTDPIEISFAGQKVNLFAIASGKGTKSTTAGCWQADANGEFSCAFVIPEGIPVGVREVEMNIPGGPTTKATYWGAGNIVDKTNLQVQTNTIYWKENTSTRTYTTSNVASTTTCSRCTSRCITCPLGQTIYVNDPDLCSNVIGGDYSDVQVTSVDLYIRNFSNTTQFFVGFVELSDSGYPKSGLDRWVSDVKVFYGSELRENGGKFEYGTAKHNVKFDTPVKLTGGKGYALVVGSPDKEARVWVAKVGGREPTINNVEGKYIYQTPDRGMLLSSPNSQTWVAYIDEDLKYAIYVKDFWSNGNLVKADSSRALIATKEDGHYSVLQYSEIVYDEASDHTVTNPNFFKFDTMYSNSDDNTGYVVFEYAQRTNGTYGNWIEFTPGTTVNLTGYSEALKIRAKLYSFSRYSSPTVDSAAAIVFGEYDLPSCYTSRNSSSGRYNRVNAYIDKFYDENKYDIDFKYSPDAGYTWRSMELSNVVPISIEADDNLTQYYQHCYTAGLTIGAPVIESLTMVDLPLGADTGRFIANRQYEVAYCLKDAYDREGPLSVVKTFTAENNRTPKITLRFDPNATGYAVYVRDVTSDGNFVLFYDSTVTSTAKSNMTLSENKLRVGPEGRLMPKEGTILVDSEYMHYNNIAKIDDSTYEIQNVQRGYTNMGLTSSVATHTIGSKVYLADQCALNRGTPTGTASNLWRFGNYLMAKDPNTKEYYYIFEETLTDRGLSTNSSDNPLYDVSYPASFESTTTMFKIVFTKKDGSTTVDRGDIVPRVGRAILNTYFEAY